MNREQSKHSDACRQCATLLHQYLMNAHWNGVALIGPDPGIRFNTRIGRFVKSYLSKLPWSDDLIYMQGQGYWVFGNWQLFDLTGDENAKATALACSDNIVERQMPEGYWEYPNPEWKSRIATVEGCFAALGLLDSYSRFPEDKYLQSAIRWFDYLISEIGFRLQEDETMWAINYFAHRPGKGGGVPNNSTLLLWFLARLYEVTGDAKFLEPCEKMVAWLKHVQLSSGELPYALGKTADQDKTHFLCFQYNAFEFMDLAYYHRITGDQEIWPLLPRLAKFLASGLTDQGIARFDCLHETPNVPYYTIAIARALSVAADLQLGDYRAKSELGFRQVLAQQRSNGSFSYHSRKNYGCLTDRRSYPRYLSMILCHLLQESRCKTAAPTTQQNTLVHDETP